MVDDALELAHGPFERLRVDDLHADGDHDRLVTQRTAQHPEADSTRGRYGSAARELEAASPDETEAEQRRAQLNRWHDDDRSALEPSEIDRVDADTGDVAASDGGPGQGR